MHKELAQLKLRIDCFKVELQKEFICSDVFISMIDFFLAHDIENRVVDFWLLDYSEEIETIKIFLDHLESENES